MDSIAFIRESNKIECIFREPSIIEIKEFDRFMNLKIVTIKDLQTFVRIYQQKAVLRDRIGLNVRVGEHIPPMGGPDIRDLLSELLSRVNRDCISAYKAHLEYESLHPFTDGNGRSGRMLWMWQMRNAPLGFLHTFYYQTLSDISTRKGK